MPGKYFPYCGAEILSGAFYVCPSGGESLLFTTRTCPNCRQAEALLQRAGVPYQKVVAEESPDLTTRYGVRQAPTLVVQGESITGLGPIKRFAEEHRAREVG